MNRSSVLVFLLVAVAVASGWAEQNGQAIDPCSLITKAEAAVAIGQIKGDPASKTGLRGTKCSYENKEGAWVTIEVYSADAHWDLVKNMATDVKELPGIRDAAFSAKRGDTRQVYMKKGASMIEVDSSAGLDAAEKVAAIAVKRLP